MSNQKKLNKAEQLLYMAETGEPSKEQVADSLMVGVQVTSLEDLNHMVIKICGESYSEMFMDLVIGAKVPAQLHEREILANFFKGRNDVVSLACFEKLRKN